jgi:hypothetical protein
VSADTEIRAEHLARGDAVVAPSGAVWTVESVTFYTDRDGKHQVAATGHTRVGQQFSMLKRQHYPVRVRQGS